MSGPSSTTTSNMKKETKSQLDYDSNTNKSKSAEILSRHPQSQEISETTKHQQDQKSKTIGHKVEFNDQASATDKIASKDETLPKDNDNQEIKSDNKSNIEDSVPSSSQERSPSANSDLPIPSNQLSGRKAARSLRIFRGIDESEFVDEEEQNEQNKLPITSPIKEKIVPDGGIDLEPVSSATYIPHTPATLEHYNKHHLKPDQDRLDTTTITKELEEPLTPTLLPKPQHLTANLEFDHGINGDITKISSVYNNNVNDNEHVVFDENQIRDDNKAEKIKKYSRSSTPVLDILVPKLQEFEKKEVSEQVIGEVSKEKVSNDTNDINETVQEFEEDEGSEFPLAVELRPFKNKVGGHTAIFSFSKQAVCKALVNRENIFYETIEIHHPELLKFMPRYIGVLNVRYSSLINEVETKQENEPIASTFEHDEESALIEQTKPHNHRRQSENMPPEVVLDDNKHIIPDTLWKHYSSSLPSPKYSNLESHSPVPSLTNSPMQRPNPGSTLVNTELQVQVLQEVFQPMKLHDEFFEMDEDREFTTPPLNDNKESTPDNEFDKNEEAVIPSSPDVLLRKHTRFERFILLEDLTCNMKRPCVLDLKMGTRQYGIEANLKKQKSQRRKCFMTTSRKLGVRVCGLQIFKQNKQRIIKDKYFGRRIKIGIQFCKILAKFLYDGESIFSILNKIPKLILMLNSLFKIFNNLPGYRMYGSSILLMFESGSVYNQVKVKIIDFAQSVVSEEEKEKSNIPPYHPNLVDKGYLKGLNSLIEYFILIFQILSKSKLTDPNEMIKWNETNEYKLINKNCPWLDDYAELENEIDGGINLIDENDPFNIDYPINDTNDDDLSE
ncbi:KCS1 [Candida pseudojiufengensis]|uniref:KCS1 n=1 Tax=Candida pseudojiufengensis TaxID=497109 RepID=UPI00222415DE|nr:KCS1 [Candida pseudojiufengensis]KAI5962327.1 KCS1 [Candida pseudojiufengensis]